MNDNDIKLKDRLHTVAEFFRNAESRADGLTLQEFDDPQMKEMMEEIREILVQRKEIADRFRK